MSQQYHMVKRRRGRPRKGESFSQAQELNSLNPIMPLSFTQMQVEQSPLQQPQLELAKGKTPPGKSNTIATIGEEQMIGRVVTGVLEGAFDAGYFLSMRVSESETCFKGLVFKQGKFVPITAANDIAPLAKLYTRMDLSDISTPKSLIKPVENVDVQLTKQSNADDAVNLVTKKQHEEIMNGLPNEASREKRNTSNYNVLANISNSMVEEEKKLLLDENEESRIAKEKLQLLASLTVEMDLPNQTHEDIEGSSEQDALMEPLAKKARTGEEEEMRLKEAIYSEELMNAATTLNQLDILEAVREH